MGRWVEFSKVLTDRLTERMGEKVAQVLFALQRDLAKMHVESHPTLVVVWDDYTTSRTSVVKTRVNVEGPAVFHVLVIAQSDEDPMSDLPFATPDDLLEEVTDLLLGWSDPKISANPAFRVVLDAQRFESYEAGIVTLSASFHVDHRIEQKPGVTAYG